MNFINKEMTIIEILNKYPETIEFFKSKGFKGFENNLMLKTVGKISLEQSIKLKKLSVDAFLEGINDFISHNIETEDITLKNSEIKTNSDISITGLLPCPVRVPLLEGFEKFKKQNSLNISADLKAASSGLDWLKESIKKDSSNISDIFISAGFDLFFEDDLMGQYRKEKIFEDITGITEYNKDFKDLNIKDPNNYYSIISVVPAVFLVNTEELGNKKFPKTWADILSDEYENSISLPVSDFDLFNAILLNIYKLYGEDGVKRLGRALLRSMHPAQMVKSDRLKMKKPIVTIMPYFFTKMTGQGGPMVAQWPEDGAIISPIFMLTKKNKKDKLENIAKFFASKEIGEILSHKGLFPSTHPKVDNKLENNKFIWLGWDFINSNDIGKLINYCEEIFNNSIKEEE
ncbi:ABC-type Fe3+ transport system substrate-binding protein [Hypnocyclicus thermotrophus]|uniref:ABC-type Fe3+ transport system substrate-binding protein n=1 Tax=Hypnocyclicus thermotrophus TaxID=1627895 RepID=A0AA46DXT8_9FUSO|nr:ABC transporter substrate-binding protein [Hypnocyclicus thermotrophus]TDT68629.1 ABC-type Fe3+ transport system substrate-binding protein [Hypnocyclicus thermotrophus]